MTNGKLTLDLPMNLDPQSYTVQAVNDGSGVFSSSVRGVKTVVVFWRHPEQ